MFLADTVWESPKNMGTIVNNINKVVGNVLLQYGDFLENTSISRENPIHPGPSRGACPEIAQGDRANMQKSSEGSENTTTIGKWVPKLCSSVLFVSELYM